MSTRTTVAWVVTTALTLSACSGGDEPFPGLHAGRTERINRDRDLMLGTDPG